MKPAFIITCEHGGNEIPSEWQYLFRDAKKVLDSHEGYDFGAVGAARFFADKINASFFSTTISRLLVDCNRSPHHPKLFSKYTRSLPRQEKDDILKMHYYPYRADVEKEISMAIDRGRRVIHLSVHTFVPRLHGKIRNTDVGILYDPARKQEKTLAVTWQKNIKIMSRQIRVRRNYPYLGKADGLVTFFRKKYDPLWYTGLELEINQELIVKVDKSYLKRMEEVIVRSFLESIQ